MIEWKIDLDYQKFFNINGYFSYDNINFFIATGGRGIGKTTSTLAKFIKDFDNNGEQFVLIRRYKTETALCKGVFDKICSGVTTKSIKGGAFEFYHNKKLCGWCIPLSIQRNVKSGINFDGVTNILYDEAIINRDDKVGYLKSEVTFFFELISTIVRLRTNYKCFIFGNNLDLFNPYYEFFNIPFLVGRYIDKERGLLVEDIKTKQALLEIEKETPLYKLTKGTTYHEYHYNNKVLVNKKAKVDIKPIRATLIGRLGYRSVTLNIYMCDKGVYVEDRDKLIKDSITYVLVDGEQICYDDYKEYKASDLKRFINYYFFKDEITYSSDKALQILNEIIDSTK